MNPTTIWNTGSATYQKLGATWHRAPCVLAMVPNREGGWDYWTASLN